MVLKKNIQAQSTLEFTFAMIATMFLIYGMVMVFRWAGMDLANRRVTQDISLTSGTNPSVQLSSGDDVVLPLSAIYHGNLTNGNTSQ